MKDLPHHMKKLNRRIIRSQHREEIEENAFQWPIPPANQKPTAKQVRKKKKIEMRDQVRARTPKLLTPEERNRKMKKRVPIFDKNNAKPKHTRASKKKSPVKRAKK